MSSCCTVRIILRIVDAVLTLSLIAEVELVSIAVDNFTRRHQRVKCPVRHVTKLEVFFQCRRISLQPQTKLCET